MKLIEFKSRYSFYKWFYRNDRSDNYPLTDFNYRHCWEEDTHIYRCVEKGKDVGVIFIICYSPGKMWIDLFEVKKGKYRTGIGTEMFKLLMEKHTPLYVKLECVEEEDEEKQAHHFWRKIGFHKTYDRTTFDDIYTASGEVFVKKYTKKFWKNYSKNLVELCGEENLNN